VKDKVPLTVLVAVKNESKNIGKCLASVAWADQVVVVDSHSTDGTDTIARQFGSEVLQFNYSGGYPKKRQWALEHAALKNDWILLLDADEEVTNALAAEIAAAISAARCSAWYIVKEFHFLGRRFRFGGFSHAAILLIRRGQARFETLLENDPSGLDMEVHERLHVDGLVGVLHNGLVHKDFKGLEAYIDRHNRYSTWEARLRMNLIEGVSSEGQIQARLFGNPQERRRFLKSVATAVPFESTLWFLYHYIWRLGFLEGRAGLIAARIRRAHFENVRAKVYELQLARNNAGQR